MQCPGQDSRYWDGEAIFEATCSKCGTLVEFFKDDSKRKCKNCGHEVLNPKIDFGCASYCAYAEHCLGTLPPEMLAQKQDLLIDRVAIEMKKHCDNDFKKIAHATKMARYADKLSKTEEGNKAVVQIASYLQQAGVQPQERPSLIRDILSKLGASEGLIEEICTIITYHQDGTPSETANFKIFHDADLIVNLESEKKDVGEGVVFEYDENVFQTQNAKVMARDILK